jgi:hypothetical protein
MKIYEQPKIIVKLYHPKDIITSSFDGDYIDDFRLFSD